MLRFLSGVAVAAAVLVFLVSRGDQDAGSARTPGNLLTQRLTRAEAHPGAAVASGVLASIADGDEAQSRIGFVNLAALGGFDGSLPARETLRLVLGPGAARAEGGSGTATQIGVATVIERDGRRVVRGGSTRLRSQLAVLRPSTSLIAAETPSAAQSCLGDSVVETILGPAVLGAKSAIGVGLQDTADRPAGPKLLVCSAPHFRRDLPRVAARLRARFGGNSADRRGARRSVIGVTDIGERDIVRAIVAVDTIDKQTLRELLAGGPALRALARG